MNTLQRILEQQKAARLAQKNKKFEFDLSSKANLPTGNVPQSEARGEKAPVESPPAPNPDSAGATEAKPAPVRYWFHPESDSFFTTVGDEPHDPYANELTREEYEARQPQTDAKQAFARSLAKIITKNPELAADYLLNNDSMPAPHVNSDDSGVVMDEQDIVAGIEYDARDDEYGDYQRRDDFEGMYNILEGIDIVPDETQRAAYQGLAQVDMGCMIGAAGTGKTTMTRFLLHTLIHGDLERGIEPLRMNRIDLNSYTGKENNDRGKLEVPSIAFAAFTGQATQVLKKNMPPAWRRNCMTIHSLLGYAPVEYEKEPGKMGIRFEPTFTATNKFNWNVIVIEEASMLNVDLWHQIRAAAHDDCRFYFIGDLNQLPPTIGETILGFALARLPVFELTTIYRQKDEAANRIIDTAHHVLNNRPLEFDEMSNHNWRVLGMKLDNSADKAHSQICAIAKGLATKRVHDSVDPERPLIYDPWRDRILTPMNGGNPDSPSSALGQLPLNESLSRIFSGDAERYVISYKKGIKKFAVGYRVMATKNEPPDRLDRVTNGLTGVITSIETNPNWIGDPGMVGLESQVDEYRRHKLAVAIGQEKETFGFEALDEDEDLEFSVDPNAKEDERQSGPSSHIVEVKFDNGGKRKYTLNSQIEQLQIAYASTTHKAQGAEMPTVIIVVHHLQRRMLCRENLYTAVTRAKERVIILYTDFGLRLALATQRIYGKTLKEKIQRYIELAGEGNGARFKVMNVKLRWDD